MSKDPQYENPKLLKLKETMQEKMEDDSRTIIFCKTSKLAAAMVKWMKEDPELKHLNPHHLAGKKETKGGKHSQDCFTRISPRL